MKVSKQLFLFFKKSDLSVVLSRPPPSEVQEGQRFDICLSVKNGNINQMTLSQNYVNYTFQSTRKLEDPLINPYMNSYTNYD